MSLKGSREFKARLRSIRQAFKPIGKAWATDTAAYARSHVPVRTGKLQRSIRVRNASQRKATVVGAYWASFIDAGTKQHAIRARHKRTLRFQSGGNTMFRKKVLHPRTPPHPFKRAAALAGLAKNPMAKTLIDEWNRAA